MGGGGVYYMISRSMGPAFGGATGLLFYICYCINSAFNATAMCEDIYNTFLPNAPKYYIHIMYHSTLAILLFIALAGAEIFAKVNGLLFGALVVAVLVVLFSMLFQPSFEIELMPAYGNMSCNTLVKDSDLYPMETNITFFRPNGQTFRDNLWPSWQNTTESGAYNEGAEAFWGDMWGPSSEGAAAAAAGGGGGEYNMEGIPRRRE